MAEYAYLSLTETPADARRRRLRMAAEFAITIGAAVVFDRLYRRYVLTPRDHGPKDVFHIALDAAIAAVSTTLFGNNSKGNAEKARRKFHLSIEAGVVSLRSPAIALKLGEIRTIYRTPSGAIYIATEDRRRKIVVPATLERREEVLRELSTFGVPQRGPWDWFFEITAPRLLVRAVCLLAAWPLCVPSPQWQFLAGSSILLAGCAWRSLRLAGDPYVEQPKTERFLVTVAAIAILWRDAHLLHGV